MLIEYLNSNDNWIEELQKEPYCLSIKQDSDYYLLKYNQIESDLSNPIVKEARGCIIKRHGGDWIYVCRPFDKFFNLHEPNADEIDWDSAVVEEKIDGSIIKMWWDNGWHISTNGIIDAFKSETGNTLFNDFGNLVLLVINKYLHDNKTEFYNKLDKDYTYIFELVSPYTQVVIKYNDIDLYLIGIRNNKTGEELDPISSNISEYFPSPNRKQLNSVEAVLGAIAALPNEKEGFVVVDKYFHRIKVKTLWYVKAHYIRNNNVITTSKLIEIILDNEIEEFLAYCEEYRDKIDELKEMIESTAATASNYLMTVKNKYPTRKDYAVAANKFGKYADFCFKNFDHDTSWEEYVSDWSASKWQNFLGLK